MAPPRTTPTASPNPPDRPWQGFTPDTFAFLTALALNNNRPWFEANRGGYETHVREPALALIAAMDAPLQTISPHYRGNPAKVGGSLMRVFRDTRFSRDKTPYKTNVGIQFRHLQAADVHAPGFYFHLEPGASFIGVGTWHPEPADLKAIRTAIATKPATWTAALQASSATGLALTGDSLKNVPRGFPADHPCATDLRRIDFILGLPLSSDDCLRPDLPDLLLGYYRAAAPLMAWLCTALGAPF